MSNNAYKNVAKVTKKIGKHGEVAVEPIGGLPFLLSEEMTVYLTPPKLDGINEVAVERIVEKGDCWAVKFSGSNCDADAFSIIGRTCLVSLEDLGDYEEEDDVYDVIGMSVIDEAAGYIGEVVDVLVNSAQATLVVEMPQGDLGAEEGGSDGRQVLIPFVDEFILEMTDDAISVDIPNDLLTLND